MSKLREWSHKLYSLGRLCHLAQNMCSLNPNGCTFVPRIFWKSRMPRDFPILPAIHSSGYQRIFLVRCSISLRLESWTGVDSIDRCVAAPAKTFAASFTVQIISLTPLQELSWARCLSSIIWFLSGGTPCFGSIPFFCLAIHLFGPFETALSDRPDRQVTGWIFFKSAFSEGASQYTL